MDDALKARIRTAYDTVAAAYAEMLPDTSYEAGVDLAMVRHFIEQLEGTGTAQVLDAGCGGGRMITYLRSIDDALALTGLDLSPAMLEQARAVHPNVVFVEGDLAALPFADGRFHGVLAWYSIIHMPPHALAGVLDEFHRVLRPGGVVLLGYQAGTGERSLSRPYGHDVELRAFLHHTPYVEAALRGAGFTVESRLDRSARETERHDQGFILARRPRR